MEPLSLNEVLVATNGRLQNPMIRDILPAILFSGISTDSRKINKGDLFFALKGHNYNGHDFIKDAIKNGAIGVVVSNGFKIFNLGLYSEHPSDSIASTFVNGAEGGLGSLTAVCFIHVSDTLKALGDLSKYYRTKMPARVVAVTGSCGKTTTKEMIYHLLSKCYEGIRSKSSFNNFIGVPLTIFELNKNHRFGVVEMDANAFGEIRRLSEIVAPDIAVITNIGETHLEGLKDIRGVQKAKAEVLEYLDADSTLILNSDDVFSREIGKNFCGRMIDFGLNKDAKIMASKIGCKDNSWFFMLNERYKIELPFPGYHNIFNSLAAIAAAYVYGIDLKDIDNPFNDFHLPPMRMDKEAIEIDKNNGKVTVINDAYNANPTSVKTVIRDFAQMSCQARKIFIFGDMLELGIESERLHIEVGREIGKTAIDLLWLIGKMSDYVRKGAIEAGMAQENISYFKNIEDLTLSAVKSIRCNDTILFKGSRAMKLEDAINGIKSYFATGITNRA